jgi:hypothetical protein
MLNQHPFQCALHDETGLCGFTPVLIVTLAAIALGWLAGYLEAVLFPGLAVLLTLTLYRLGTSK